MKILDAHTHLSGSETGETAKDIIACMDACDVDISFVYAPLLNVHSWELSDEHLQDIRLHNDYCSDLCSSYTDRLYGFCVLNPVPSLAGGSLERAVTLMTAEVRRCYHDLGLRGVKMVPTHWYPNAPELVPLYHEIAHLGMYVVFHAGIFMDGQQGSYCRPTYFEGIRQVPKLKVQLAHLGWPWVDEAIAVLNMESNIHGPDPANWQFRADVSFGPPDDWQLSSWQRAVDSLPPTALIYGSDLFWPTPPEEYQEKYLYPQRGLFEVSVTNGHITSEGSPTRKQMREQVFFQNALNHWNSAVHKPQRPQAAKEKITTSRARQSHRQHTGR
ncbi:MAG: amidohydrolase family protein [Ktedonobacteraceae bacterium]|nr:amidohydrolase family protein [Ktedonobacteraceae bacterium]MBV9020572.1 amidohydrolase family protein [Ktedonobacteraceae bacterium]